MTKQISSLGYQIFFETKLESLTSFITSHNYSQLLVLVDRNTNNHCLPILQSALSTITDYDIIEVDPGEENKNIDFCIGVWKTMLDFGADRKALLINLGGGVVTDMGGFAASTYKRGIDFIQIPTTLLSQVDASVGGKTGIDLDNVKNMIGTFTQPQAVFISGQFLSTLDGRQMRSGFAEVMKHGLIYDKDLFTKTEAVDLEKDDLDDIVFRSVEIKNEVVTVDPTEKGLRKILNYGHTIGHAIEGYSMIHDDDPLLHGEAIAAGMICEAYIAHQVNGLSKEGLSAIVRAFDNRFERYKFSENSYPELFALMQNDKKNEGRKLGFALLSAIGKCDYDIYVDEELIKESLNFYRNRGEG